MVKICIVSGTDRHTLRSDVNHRHYADLHGYDYSFDTSLYRNLPSPHFRKLVTAKQALRNSDWVFWLDDDAFFTDMSTRLESFLQELPEDVFLVLCSSPINQKGGWTYISSGQFFLKNDGRAYAFIDSVLSASVETVRDWWDPALYGMFTKGDQDSIVYSLVTKDLLQFTHIYPHDAFNNRPHHYCQRLNEHFLVHFPGSFHKRRAIREFSARFGVDDTLIASNESRESRVDVLRKMLRLRFKQTKSVE